jgi:pyrroline-5-carboxylate reductase
MRAKGGSVLDGDLRIGLIGGGSMGEAFIGALAKSLVPDPAAIMVSDVDSERLAALQRAYGISVAQSNTAVFSRCNTVIFAVKPQQMAGVLSEITDEPNYRIDRRKIVISIAAGISLSTIEAALYAPLDDMAKENLPLIRVMPNTPALVLKGMSGMSANRYVENDDKAVAVRILSAMGKVIEFSEHDLNAVTALSGSGPAYVFYLVESMIAAGLAMGLSSDDASMLTLTTVEGALALLSEQSESAEELRRRVTSPGGTTEAAFQVLERSDVKQIIVNAITAAKRRGEELSSAS